MEKNLCFILDGRKIYMDKCLIEDEIPIFFSCTDTENNYYVALCTDMDLPVYCVVKTTITQLRDMLYGKIPMRDIFIRQKFYWEIVSTDGKAVNDIVEYKSINEIASEDLPVEESCFSLFSEELQEYAELISRKILEGCFDSFPMLTNEALKDVNDGNEINVQVKYNMVSALAEAYSRAIKLKYIAATKIIGKFKLEYDMEENCILTKEKKPLEGGDMADGKVCVENPTDKEILLLAA